MEIRLTEFDDLIIAVGNSTKDTLDSLKSSSDWRREKFVLIVPPFKTQCVGMATDSVRDVVEFTLNAKSMVLLYLPVLMAVGLLLFFTAHSLSRFVCVCVCVCVCMCTCVGVGVWVFVCVGG